jgi:RND family efflux transporter MFP subunit
MLLLVVLDACGGKEHGHATAHEDDETPGVSVTLWGAHHELFAEYPALIVGQPSALAAHVTTMPAFKAATAGSVRVELVEAGGAPITARADVSTHPGIFRPVVTPGRPGACTLRIVVETTAGSDVFTAPQCTVFPDLTAAKKAHADEEEPVGRITYLKEQAWTTDFATAVVAERALQPGIRATGEIRPVAGLEARLTAGVPGRVILAEPAPALGMRVEKGQVLARITPRLAAGGDRASLDAETRSTRAELDAAESQLARTERLWQEKTVSQRGVEEARARVRVARARQDAADARLGQFDQGAAGATGKAGATFQVRSPIAGMLVAVKAAFGQSVEEGEPLFTVIDVERVWVEARVFEHDLARLLDDAAAQRVATGPLAWLVTDGAPEPIAIERGVGRLVTIGHLVDEHSRTVAVLYELPNPGGRLRIGQFARVTIAMGAPLTVLAIPETALIEEAGRPIAYVQVEGESFERRPLKLGERSGGWVEVDSGLKAGEHVVVRAAYDIKLSSASGSVPAHGHAH